MKITIIGAGAIGSVVAAYLTKAGLDVTLIARDYQVDVLNKSGLHIVGVRGEETIKIKAKTTMDEEADLVIFATKSQDLEQAYQQNHAFLENGMIMTSQNGVQADNMLSAHFSQERQLSSIVMFGASYVEGGKITFNFEGDWIVGKPFMPLDPKVHEMAAVLKQAFSVEVTNDIMGMKWLKLFINFNNCICALIGKPMQETFDDMDMCRLSILLLKEGVDIVQKLNIELESMPQFPKERILGLAQMPMDQAAGIINQTLKKLSDKPVYGSILQSVMRGKTSEIDFINGEVVHLAKQIRQEAPLNEKVVDMIHTIERTGKYFEVGQVKEEFKL